MTQVQEHMLALVSGAMWGTAVPDPVSEELLPQIMEEATAHGVLPLMLTGAVSALGGKISPELRSRWRTVLFSTAMGNDMLMTEQDAVASVLDGAGIPFAVLKGSSLSVYYRQPDVRPLGDIDLLVRREDLEKVRSLLLEQGYADQPAEHTYHISMCRGKVVLEIHYAMSRPHESEGGRLAEEQIRAFADHIQRKTLENHRFPVLDETRQALSLLLHMESHLAFGGLGLRQLCDWAAFVASVPAGQFAGEVLPLLDECGLGRFARVVTRSCRLYLQLPAELAPWCMNAPETLCAQLLAEMLRTGNMGRAVQTVDLSYLTKSAHGSKGPLGALWSNLWNLIRGSHPIVEKYPVLFPICLVHRFAQFLWRQIREGRLLSTLRSSAASARSQETLYDQMHLFETGKDN